MKHRRHPNFPSYRFYSDRRIMNKTTNRFIKVKPHMKLIDAEGKRKSITSDNGNIVISINRVIIRK